MLEGIHHFDIKLTFTELLLHMTPGRTAFVWVLSPVISETPGNDCASYGHFVVVRCERWPTSSSRLALPPHPAGLLFCNPKDCSLSASLCPWNFPGKNTAVGCHFLLRVIFPTQGLNPSLWHLCIGRQIFCHWHHLGSLGSGVKNPSAKQETWVRFLGWENHPE